MPSILQIQREELRLGSQANLLNKLERIGGCAAVGRSSKRDVFTNACSAVLAICFFVLCVRLSVIQMQRINLKFHNQLHFKSYIHILYMATMKLFSVRDMIPVVDSKAFYSQ